MFDSVNTELSRFYVRCNKTLLRSTSAEFA